MAKRPIREVKKCLKTYCSQKHKNWALCISDVNTVLNEIHNKTTVFTLNELHAGQQGTRFWEPYTPNHYQTDIPLESKLFLADRRIIEKQASKLNQNFFEFENFV